MARKSASPSSRENGDNIPISSLNTEQDRLPQIEKSKKTLQELKHAEVKLNDFCEAIRHQIDYSSNETKRLALDALDVKVYATPYR